MEIPIDVFIKGITANQQGKLSSCFNKSDSISFTMYVLGRTHVQLFKKEKKDRKCCGLKLQTPQIFLVYWEVVWIWFLLHGNVSGENSS